ncbi:MAG TPA: histidine phosphatase family protein [Bacilli bacterium]|nr:histidine phosphatase family protein [Bacilli bacterium]
MKLYLVRHGETDGNRERRYIGRTDCPLNDAGRAQATELGAKLSSTPFHAVISSPMQRTRETAELILAGTAHSTEAEHRPPRVPMQTDDRLAELHFGTWEGLTFEEVARQDRERIYAWYDDPWDLAPPEGESLQAMDARLTEWVEETLCCRNRQLPPNLLLVSHGGPLRWLLAKYLYRDTTEFARIALSPGQLVVCTVSDNGTRWKLEKGAISQR